MGAVWAASYTTQANYRRRNPVGMTRGPGGSGPGLLWASVTVSRPRAGEGRTGSNWRRSGFPDRLKPLLLADRPKSLLRGFTDSRLGCSRISAHPRHSGGLGPVGCRFFGTQRFFGRFRHRNVAVSALPMPSSGGSLKLMFHNARRVGWEAVRLPKKTIRTHNGSHDRAKMKSAVKKAAWPLPAHLTSTKLLMDQLKFE